MSISWTFRKFILFFNVLRVLNGLRKGHCIQLVCPWADPSLLVASRLPLALTQMYDDWYIWKRNLCVWRIPYGTVSTSYCKNTGYRTTKYFSFQNIDLESAHTFGGI